MPEEIKPTWEKEFKDTWACILTTRQIELIIHSIRQVEREAEIRGLCRAREIEWKPTCGYDSEEEKGFQDGIQAQIQLTNKRIDEMITNLKKKQWKWN